MTNKRILLKTVCILITLSLFSCNNVVVRKSVSNTIQKSEFKTIREYVNDNDFISIIPDVYDSLVSHSSSKEELRDLEKQMVAATYRFYKNCTQDDKGRITCQIFAVKL